MEKPEPLMTIYDALVREDESLVCNGYNYDTHSGRYEYFFFSGYDREVTLGEEEVLRSLQTGGVLVKS